MRKLALCCDHGGFECLQAIKAHLDARGVDYCDFGTYSAQSCDYPDYARKATEAISRGECDLGVFVCTTGIGMCIVANKVKGIYAALVLNEFSSRSSRTHNNANVICISAKFTPIDEAIKYVDNFISESFSEDERHRRRVEKVVNTEKDYFI